MTIHVQAEGKESSSILSDGMIVEATENEAGNKAIVQFQWRLNESVAANQPYIAELPDNTASTEEQTGELTFEDGTVGSFLATEAGEVSVQFDEGIEGLETAATGVFEVTVVVENAEGEAGEEVVEEEDERSEEVTEETTLEQSEEDSAADQEKSDAEEATEDNGTEEESISKKQETNTKGNTLADAEEHGFTLELDEILDLDDTAFDEQHPM